jgi:hypothetical protein
LTDTFAGDHVLRRHVQDDRAQSNPHHLLHDRNEQDQARALDSPEAAEHEDHATLVFAQDAKRREDHQSHQQEQAAEAQPEHHDLPP